MSRQWPKVQLRWLLLLAALHALPFFARPALIGGDENHYALMAFSLGVDGDADLTNNYAAVAAGSPAAGRKRAGQELDHHTRMVHGVAVFTHAIGISLLAAPFVGLLHVVCRECPPDLLLVGLTLLLTYVTALLAWRELAYALGNRWRAAFWVGAGYFCSPLWFYSRTFFTEPFSWSFAILTLVAVRRRQSALAAVALCLLVMTKETTALLVPPLLAMAVVELGLRSASRIALGALIGGLTYPAVSLLQTGHLGSGLSQTFQFGNLFAGMSGLLFDPGQGLVVLAPHLVLVALLSLPRLWRLPPDRRRGALASIVAFASYFLVSAAWIDWRGGACFGPRLLVPVLPALIILGSPLELRSRWERIAVGLAAAAGFTVNWAAALSPWRAMWNGSWAVFWETSPASLASGAVIGLGLAYWWLFGSGRWSTADLSAES